MKHSRKNKMAVVGLGYVGLPLALLAKQNGYDVVGIDNDQNKLTKINDRQSPFKDKKIDSLLKKFGFTTTDNFSIICEVRTIIVCVPTPVFANHKPNLNPLKNACRNIGGNLVKDSLVIIESTVNPGVCDDIVIPIIEKYSGLECGHDFYLAHCPERINPGDKNWNVENIPRVIGGYDTASLRQATNFYTSILTGSLSQMHSIKEAEACKIVENSFRDINIAFVNELAKSFDKLGIDLKNVITGASSKPFGYLAHWPGCGVGGHCIPVDPYYLIDEAKSRGFNHEFLKLARNINNSMPRYTVSKVDEGLKDAGLNLSGSAVTVLGLAYKPNISDDRESPSYKIIEYLKRKGAIVKCYDPFLLDKSTAASLDASLNDTQAVVIATPHEEFLRVLTPERLKSMGIRVVVDGNNSLDKPSFVKAGITYKGIGR
jgi:nucleotide sugar dehydrogenase